jgi:hypothetical protein
MGTSAGGEDAAHGHAGEEGVGAAEEIAGGKGDGIEVFNQSRRRILYDPALAFDPPAGESIQILVRV